MAKRAAAKVVRRKINESQSHSKASINVTNGHNDTITKGNNNSNNNGNPVMVGSQNQGSQGISQGPSFVQSRITSTATSPTNSILSAQHHNQASTKDQNQQAANHNSGAMLKGKISLVNTKKEQIRKEAEEEKVIPPTQHSTHPQKPLHSYEVGPLDKNQEKQNTISNSQRKQGQNQQQQVSHKPSPSMNSSSNQRNEGRLEDGEKILNKRQQMRMPNAEQKRTNAQHNVTRSLIDEGSEDFTNIEEHINNETKISCRNAVASSLNNVSILFKKGVISNHGTPTQQQLQQLGIRHRRGTTQSNMSGMPSNQPSKEETFETSSFFDERCGSNRGTAAHMMNGASPHKCNQVDGYNMPTIFNTLVYGIDKNKVSDNVRESFSSLSQRNQQQQQPQQVHHSQQHYQQQIMQQSHAQGSKSYQQQLSSQFAKKKMSDSSKKQPKEGLSNFVTKVEKGPIVIYDNQQISTTTQSSKAQEASPKSKNGKKSALSVAAQQRNGKADHTGDHHESLKTTQADAQLMSISSHDQEEEQVANQAIQQIEDFQSSELHRNHLIQTLQSLQYIKTLPPPLQKDIKSRQVKLPPPKSANLKKTIIFDLDETLVHCIDDIENNPCDQVINVTFPNGDTVQAGINVRPYAIECLRKANENYQVVVFTASHRAYADVVLDSLDPDRSLIQYRLYREHCIRTEEGIYIKDLRIISNRNLKDLIIVDNAVYSFGYQLDNGIPIIPFYDDKNDEELMHLIYYFNCLSQCSDVREQNRKAFQLKDLQEIDIGEYLQSMMQSQHSHQQE